MLIKQAGLRKVNYKFLSLYFPLLAIKLLIQIGQTENSNFGRGVCSHWSIEHMVGHELMNSVGGAGGREETSTFICYWNQLVYSLQLCCLPLGCQWKTVHRAQLCPHQMPLPSDTEMFVWKVLTIPALKGWISRFNQARNHIISFFLVCLFQSL